ncbi:UNVERIFIED_CONTAM: hypothetical protein FKN15_037057 [Acipenser sinensis]
MGRKRKTLNEYCAQYPGRRLKSPWQDEAGLSALPSCAEGVALKLNPCSRRSRVQSDDSVNDNMLSNDIELDNTSSVKQNVDDESHDICNFSEAQILDNIDNHVVISSEDDTDDTEKEEKSLVEDIASWMTTNQIKHNAADDLLKLLIKHGSTDLPSSARTLLETPKNVQVEMKSGLEYVYLGVGELLIKNLDKYPSETK